MLSLKREYFRIKIRKTSHQQLFNSSRVKTWLNCLSEEAFYNQVDFSDHESFIALLKCLNETTNKQQFTRVVFQHLLQIFEQRQINLELIFNLNFFLDFESPQLVLLIQSTRVIDELIDTIQIGNYDMKIYILAQFAQAKVLKDEIIESFVIFDILEIFGEILGKGDQLQTSTYKSYFILLYVLIEKDDGLMERSLNGIYKAVLCMFLKIDSIACDHAIGFIVSSALRYDFCGEALKEYFHVVINRMFEYNIRGDIVKVFWQFCNNWVTKDPDDFLFFCRNNSKILNLVTISLEQQENSDIIQEILWNLDQMIQDELLVKEFIHNKYHHRIYLILMNMQTLKLYENYFKVIYGFLIKSDKNFVDAQLIEMLQKCLSQRVENPMKACVNYIVKNLGFEDLAYLIDLI